MKRNSVAALSLAKAMLLTFVMLAMSGAPSWAGKSPGKPPIPGRQPRMAIPRAAGAVRGNAGFNANVLPANDDGSTGSVAIGFPINFLGAEHSTLFVNNNGNVTFDSSLGEYTPFNLSSLGSPIIAPFFADVDTRAGALVTYGNSTVNGHSAFGVNWVNVGYYSRHLDRLNSFQLVLIDRHDTGAGNFDIEFNYNFLTWETGDASGGDGGLGGTPAIAGYASATNDPSALRQLPGSQIPGGLLDSNGGTSLSGHSLNSPQLGRYVFAIRTGSRISFLDNNPDCRGQARTQAVADGATQVLVHFHSATPGRASFHYSHNLPGDRLSQVSSMQAPINVALTSDDAFGGYACDALYTVPMELPTDERTHAVTFSVDYIPTSGQSTSIEPLNLTLVRPPVMLIHGLWSNSSTWTGNGTLQQLQAAGYTVRSENYGASDGPGDSAKSFSVNTPKVSPWVEQIVQEYRSGGTAITRVDAVGHSMGGLLARLAVQAPGYAAANNFGKGYLRRIVTLGTPHAGSPLANDLIGAGNDFLFGRVVKVGFTLAGLPIDEGGVADLQVGSGALHALGATAVPAYAVIGDVNPATALESDQINNLFNLFKFFGITINGLDLTNPSTLVNSVFNRQANDLIVPGTSQQGGLSSAFALRVPNTAHINIPQVVDGETNSAGVGARVVAVLNGPQSALASGFPASSTVRTTAKPVVVVKHPLTRDADLVTPFIALTSPANGATLTAGATFTMTAVPIGNAAVSAVMFGAGHTLQFGVTALDTTAPFTTTIQIPNTAVGEVPIYAFGRNTAGAVCLVQRTITVQPNATLQQITVTPAPLFFFGAGDTQPLSVQGLFSDNITRDVTAAGAGTTYSSQDPRVATVDSHGLVTAVGNGNTLISVRNGARSTIVVVQNDLDVPQLFSVTPSHLTPGDSNVAVTITGTGFNGIQGLAFLRGGVADSDLTVSNLQVNAGGTQLTALVSLNANAVPGNRLVQLLAGGGQTFSNGAVLVEISVPGATDVTNLFRIQKMGPAGDYDRLQGHKTLNRQIMLYNSSGSTISGPLYLVFDNFPAEGILLHTAGSTRMTHPMGSPYLQIALPHGNLRRGETIIVNFSVRCDVPPNRSIPLTFGSRVLQGPRQP